jgi:hypothetical protein
MQLRVREQVALFAAQQCTRLRDIASLGSRAQ